MVGVAMKYKQFEDLPVWRKAIELAVRVHSLRTSGALFGYADMRDQMERAALSISNNIAEGFERGTRDELLSFLYIARGSAGEVRSMTHLCNRLRGAGESDDEMREVRETALEISRQLGGWIESLKNTEALSPRERTEATKQAESEARRREAFLRHLQHVAKGELSAKLGDKPEPG
jgi:four helix bundle protein